MRDVYIIDGNRTPFIRAAGKPNPLSASDLALEAIKPLLARQNFKPSDIEEVIMGCMVPSHDEANIARQIALRSGCGDNVMGWTVQRNCASGLQSLDCAFMDIATGKHDLVLAGGTEAMSRAPLIYNAEMTNWFADLNMAKTTQAKLKVLTKFRLRFISPIVALLRGLSDPIVNCSMGQTAEKIAFKFKLSRAQLDEYSCQSNLKAAAALNAGRFNDEMTPMFDWRGNVIKDDNGIRADSSVEKLSKLKAVFEKPFGVITAGNSSQITDGSAVLLLASKEAVQKYNLKPMARIIDVAWAALDPTVMGLGPAHSIAKVLTKNKLALKDVDFFEINEAFAAQVLGCVHALDSEEYCQEHLGLKHKMGLIPMERINVDGGAIAIGHPVGASGARIVLHLLHTLEQNNAKKGVASLCIGGGQGGSMLIERLNGRV
jgi:acetyl-CoA C-acetyltransferase